MSAVALPGPSLPFFSDAYGTERIPSPPVRLRPVKLAVYEVFQAETFLGILGQIGIISVSFLQKSMKKWSYFHCRIPIAKVVCSM